MVHLDMCRLLWQYMLEEGEIERTWTRDPCQKSSDLMG